MRRAGIKGLPGNRRPRPRHQTPTAGDLVHRQFTRPVPDQLWVTDITEHPTREGKVYCAVVLDTCSRRVVGWSIDSSQTAALVTSALDMAIRNRAAQALAWSSTPITECKADSTGRRNTSITEVCDGGEQEADAADARGCTPAVGSGSGVAAADAFTGPA